MIFKKYNNPEYVGWQGWIENITGEPLAYIRLNGEVVWTKQNKKVAVRMI